MIVRVNKYWFTYTLVKVVYMFLALFIYSRFTTLGDVDRYLSGPTYGSFMAVYNSTYMMDFLAHSFTVLLGPVFANLPFALLSVYGIYYAVKRLELNNRELTFLLALLSFPSFGIWTSIASKEAMSVFFMGIILGFIIDVIKGGEKKDFILIIFAFYLCAIFKPQYLSGIIALLIYVFISKKMHLKAYGKIILLGIFFLLSFLVLYIFRNEINELSFVFPSHFSSDAGSTRENLFWVKDFDVFLNAPYGMFIAFFGPTFSEAMLKLPHLFVFIESIMILIVFVCALIKLFLITLSSGRLNVYFVSIFLIATLWILFVHYPFGALNPGSAIRYRENFYSFFVILFYFSYIEVKKRHFHYKCNHELGKRATSEESVFRGQ